MTETPTQIAKHFSAMDDSVNLIVAVVEDDASFIDDDERLGADGVKLMVTRNTDHLEIQLAKDWAIADDRSKTSYTNAITAGKAYVAE